MVRVYHKGIRSGLEIMVPGLGCFYDGQHLLVMNRIVPFGGGHGMQHVCDGSEFAIIAFDANHSPDGELRRVSLEAEFVVLIGVLQDELKSGSDDEPEIYDAKVGERKRRRQAKKEAKEKEARERQQREEAECRAREEAATVWRQEEADCRVREECQAKEEREHQEKEAAVRWEAAIKKATETAEKRTQGDTEDRQAEAAKKVWAVEEMARQREEAEASKQKSVVMKKRAREENTVAGPSGMPGPGLQ